MTAAPLTIAAVNQSNVYGAAIPSLTASYAGFVNGDTAASLTTPPTLTTAATAASHVGSYGITASGAVDSDYSIRYASGTLTVTPAALTITADNEGMVYGGTLPALTVTYAGLVNGDTPATFSTAPNTAPTVTTSATASSPEGAYLRGEEDSVRLVNKSLKGCKPFPVQFSVQRDPAWRAWRQFEGGENPSASCCGLLGLVQSGIASVRKVFGR